MGIFKRSRGVYEVTLRRKGHNIRQTFASLDEAKEFESAQIRAIATGTIGRVDVQHRGELALVAHLLERYLSDETPLKKGKVRERSRLLKLMCDPIASVGIFTIDSSDVSSYIARRRADGVADATVRIEVMLLSAVFRTARKKWRIKCKNPVDSDEVELPAPSRERVRRLKSGEYRRLLSGLRRLCRNPRIIDAVRFAVRTGMRQGEILGLHRSMIDKTNRVISLPDSKTGRRDVPISNAALRIIDRCSGDIPFVCSADRLSRAFKESCNAGGIVDLHFHDLRHEAISRFFERGLDVTEVAMISGHRTLSVLMRYTHHRAARISLKLNPRVPLAST